VNGPIVRLYVFIALLFAVLVGATAWWTVYRAEELRAEPANRRAVLAEERIKRGVIRTADGKVIAGSRAIAGKRYERRYPLGDLFGHPVGYSFTRIGRSGLERFRNDQLTGREDELISVVDSLLGKDRIGHDVVTTLNARAQEVAMRALGDRKGAVVALDVKTGGVLVMASKPGYDPNGLDDTKTFEALNRDNENSRLLNRATQGLYPPGSTMKVVTAAAALDSGRYKPDTRVSGKNGKRISGVPLNNFGNQDFGEIDLTTALTKSVNTVWAEVAEKLGKGTYAEYMERFGFGEEPEMDYPGDQIFISGTRRGRRVVSARSRTVDIGRVGIGQGTLLVTPLQMAMVVQTVANGGRRMVPHITSKVLDEDGRVVEEVEPEEAAEVMDGDAADALASMMRKVVEEGTGTAAALQGVSVAGKTGTAELNNNDLNQPWFTGFTDEFAVAVTVERVQGGTGGEVAAPIAKAVLEALGE
jgi:penicillin-binding protein A